MKKEHVIPFVKGTMECFTTMVDVTPVQKEIKPLVPKVQQHDVSAIIGLSGDAKGMVSLTMKIDTALKVVSQFTGDEETEMNEDVTDAVGELINIIAGNAKAELQGIRVMISLPSVMHGENYFVSIPKNAEVISISFDLPDLGEIHLIVSLIPNGN